MSSLLLLLPGLVVGAASGYQGVLTGAAWRAVRRGHAATPLGDAPRHRFAVLVPAHDEADVIDATLRSVRSIDYPRSMVSVHVVADNCGDDTAAIARRHDVAVHEREAPEAPGKGPALSWLMDRLDAQGERHDAVVILDADSVVSPNFLRVMDARLAAGDRIVQCHYAVRDPERSWAVALRYAALAVRHYLRPLARTSFGGSAGLYGNGMAFRSEVLRGRRWSDHLTEDIEFEAELLLAGERVAFAPDARLEAEMPARLADARTQNERWEQGRLQVARTYVPRLLRRTDPPGVRARAVRVDAAVDHLLPPFSLLAGATAALGAAAIGLRLVRRTRLSGVNVALAAVAGGVQATALVSGLRMVDAPPAVWRALPRAPVFILWKLGLLRRALSRGHTVAWVRTPRNR